MKILLVEDEAEVVDQFMLLTTDRPNVELATAQSFIGAKKLIKESDPFDFIFLDHFIPNRNEGYLYFPEPLGYSLVSLIREKMPKACIVGISSAPLVGYVLDQVIIKLDIILNPEKVLDILGWM